MTPDDLRAARHALGLTQTELAECLGVKQPNISAWETGKRRIDKRTALAVAALSHEKED